jgi:hypothetical protein
MAQILDSMTRKKGRLHTNEPYTRSKMKPRFQIVAGAYSYR